MNDLRLLNQRRFPLQLVLTVLFVVFSLFGSNNQRLIALFWLLCMVALYVVVLIHELGHLIAGLHVGYRFSVFSIGIFTVYRDGERLRFTLRRLPWHPVNFLGFTLFLINDYTDFRRRMFWYVLGGPLANALVVLVAGVLYSTTGSLPNYDPFTTPPVTWLSAWTWHIFIFCLFWAALLLLIASLYPSEWLSTDGNKLVRLLRGGAFLARFQAQMQVGMAVLQGVRPREWDSAWIEPLTALIDNSADTVNCHLLAYRWALDRGDEQQAEMYLSTAVKLRNRVSPAERANILVEAAYVEMRYHANAQNAEGWIKKLGTDQKRAQPLLRLRMACAANLLLNQYPETRDIAKQAVQVLDRAKASDGISIMERDLFRDMADRATVSA